jgi:hypothetical protein
MISVLKQAINLGIKSGVAKNFNAEKHLAKLKSAMRKKM